MHGAPPVRLDCGCNPPWRWAHAVLGTIVGASLAAWLLALAGAPAAAASGVAWRMIVLSASAVAGGLIGARLARVGTAEGSVLRWDGSGWLLDEQPGRVSVALDLGAWMLLRFVPHGGGRTRWLPLTLLQTGADVQLCRTVLHLAVPADAAHV